MVNLNDYLKLNSNAIVDFVERKYVPDEMSQESTFEGLAGILQGMFLHRHGSEEEAGSTSQCSCNGHNIFNVVRMGFPSKSK